MKKPHSYTPKTSWILPYAILPIFLQLLLEAVIPVMDKIMLSHTRFSTPLLSGIGLAEQLLFFFFILNSSLANGVAIILARYKNAHPHSIVCQYFQSGWINCFALTALSLLTLTFGAPFFLSLLSHNQHLIHLALYYIHIDMWSLLFYFPCYYLFTSLRATDIWNAGWISFLFALLTKFVGNWFAIHHHSMMNILSLMAISHIICVIIQLLVLLFFLKAVPFIHKKSLFALPSWPFYKNIQQQTWKLSWPIIADNILWSLASLVFTHLYSHLPTPIFSQWFVLLSLARFVQIIFFTLAYSAFLELSGTLGSSQPQKAQKKLLLILSLCPLLGLLAGLIFYLCVPWIALLYPQIHSALLQSNLHAFSFSLFFSGWDMVILFIFYAGGKTRLVFVIDMLVLWVIHLPILYYCLFHTHLGLGWIYTIEQASDTFPFILFCLPLLWKKKWFVLQLHTFPHNKA